MTCGPLANAKPTHHFTLRDQSESFIVSDSAPDSPESRSAGSDFPNARLRSA